VKRKTYDSYYERNKTGRDQQHEIVSMVTMEQEIAANDIADLLANDASRDFINIVLGYHENDPAALANALRQNRSKTFVQVTLCGIAPAVNVDAHFALFFQELERLDNLESLWLSSNTVDHTIWQLSNVRSRPFFRPIQHNKSITAVYLDSLLLSGNDLTTLLDNSPAISYFEMKRCVVESQEDNAAIASALERSTTIESLKL